MLAAETLKAMMRMARAWYIINDFLFLRFARLFLSFSSFFFFFFFLHMHIVSVSVFGERVLCPDSTHSYVKL